MKMEAIVISNSILKEMWKRDLSVRPMKLQKILYYTVGFSYKEKKKIISNEYFYKWDYGPVIPEIYYAFEKYRAKPIQDYEKGNLDKKYIVAKEDKDFYSVLHRVIDTYGAMSDVYLSNLTHHHASWKESELYKRIGENLIGKTFKNLAYGK